jgi:hypothetical protein
VLLAVQVVQDLGQAALAELVRLVKVVLAELAQLMQVVAAAEQVLLERLQLLTRVVLVALEQAHPLLAQQLLTLAAAVVEAMASPVRQAVQEAAVRVVVAITVMLALQAL